jgi:hypothetical protein
MKIKLLVAAAATVVASSAMAQSAFEGFYGQLATGYESNQLTNTSTTYNFVSSGGFTGNGSLNAGNQNANGMPLIAGIGYNFKIDDKWLLGIGADYSFLTRETGSFTAIDPSDGFPFNSTLKVKNRYNVFLSPAYAIDKEKLVYFKAGYSGQTLESSSPTQGSTPALNSSATQSGYVLGLGYKQIISGGLYGFAEGNYMSYGKGNQSSTFTDSGTVVNTNANVGASAYTLLVGVGYKF